MKLQIYFLSILLLLTQSYLYANECNADKLKKAMEGYLVRNDIRSYKKIYYNIYSNKCDREAVKNSIMNEKTIGLLISKVEDQDLRAQDICFALLKYSDGGLAGTMSIVLGEGINKNPYQFLKILQKHFKYTNKYILNSVICNLGPNYVDKFNKQKREYRRRIKKLQRVNNKKFSKAKKYCISVLIKCLTDLN